jgi:hypothetical protein
MRHSERERSSDVTDPEVDRMAKYLGPNRDEVKRLLAHASRGKIGTDVAKNVLRAMIRRTGANPGDLSLFPLVLDLPPGEMRIGRVINGTTEGPVFALSAGSSADIQHVGVSRLLATSATGFGRLPSFPRNPFSLIAYVNILCRTSLWRFAVLGEMPSRRIRCETNCETISAVTSSSRATTTCLPFRGSKTLSFFF